MKASDAVAMTVEEALTHSDEWTKGQTFYPGAQGWRVVCAVLASEVHRLRDHSARILGMVEPSGREEIEVLKATLEQAKTMRPLDDYHEDYGYVLWWVSPVCEPPYCGTPNDSDWPGYHTHWTPLITPDEEQAK